VRQRRFRIRAAACLAAAVVTTAFAAASAEAVDPATVQADVDAVHDAGAIGVIARVRDGSGAFAARAGVANVNTGAPIKKDSYIRIGSATKPFIATVILQLVGEGELSLDDTVDDWLPGLVSGNGNDGSAITVRQLLQHTSGIQDYFDDLYEDYDTPEEFEANRLVTYTPEQLVAMAVSHPPLFAPGTDFSYSNTGYVIAGMIIEEVTGETWEHEVRQRILDELDLEDTFTPDVRTSLPAPHPRLYNQFAEGGPFVDVTVPALADETTAAGALISTTRDLGHFFRALMRGGLLDPAEMTALKTTVPDPQAEQLLPGSRYGLGIEYHPLSCGGAYWSHGGDGFGYGVDDGVTEDGQRSAVIFRSSRPAEIDPFLGQLFGSFALVDHALCAD
jgi:D-alanyl-D-alanine carboxypeptidase